LARQGCGEEPVRVVQLDLTDAEALALLNLLIDTIEADRSPNWPRIRVLRAILAKFGSVGWL
jgi:hypothetical protein